MGQKVNPHGARVGVIYDWSTRWYAGKKDFANNLNEDFRLRKMLKEKFYQTGISRIDIERSAQRMNVTIFTGKPADPALTKAVGDMWANFARSGDPSIPSLKWRRYDAKQRLTAILSRSPRIQSDPLGAQRKQLEPLLRYMLITSYETMDYNVPFVRIMAAFAAGTIAAIAAAGVLLYKASKKRKM